MNKSFSSHPLTYDLWSWMYSVHQISSFQWRQRSEIYLFFLNMSNLTLIVFVTSGLALSLIFVCYNDHMHVYKKCYQLLSIKIDNKKKKKKKQWRLLYLAWHLIHFGIIQRIQWKLCITRSLGPRNCVCYIRYFVISVVNKQYKTKEINSVGPEKFVCYIRYFVISDLFISSFHCTSHVPQSHLPKAVPSEPRKAKSRT